MAPWLQPVVFYNRVKARARRRPDHFMARVPGLIHVGANVGQERKRYNKYGLHVIWVEPIPEVFAELQQNIADMPRHRAFEQLITDQKNQEYVFHVASNRGESSSILPLKEHKEIWQNIYYERDLILQSNTLDSMVAEENLDLQKHRALVLDTQGSELLVLKGAKQTLKKMAYVKVEAADFESYEGCATVDSLGAFMADQGFTEITREAFAAKDDGTGHYYDLVFKRDQSQP